MKKYIQVGLKKTIITLVILMVVVLVPTSKADAYLGVADFSITHDPMNFVQNSVSATENAITAGATTANAAATIADKIKTFVLDVAARAAVKVIIQRLTISTVNWINSGFRGNPTYVQDPGKFFLGIADTEASHFLSYTGLDALCSPFKAQVRLALVKNYLQDNRDNYTCSLSILKNNYENFTNDFRQGGWEAWFEMTENPQNNAIGSYIAAKNQLGANIGFKQSKYDVQLTQGRGFLSFEKCPAGEELDPSLGTGDCKVEKYTATPGSVIEEQLNTVLPTGLRQLELAKNFDEILGAAVTQLFSKAIGAGKGLFDGGAQSGIPDLPNDGGPTIVLQGANPIRVITGSKYIDPGAIAYDTNGKDVSSEVVIDTSEVTTNIPTASLGTDSPGYTVKYTITRKGKLVASETRTVIVGSTIEAVDPSQCLDPGFINYISIWPNVIDTFVIKLNDINQTDILRKMKLMITAGNKEREYLISQNKNRIVTDLEDLLIKMDRFNGHIDRADEDSINDVISLQHERDDMKALILKLKGQYTCPIPSTDFGDPVPTDVATDTGGGGGGGGGNACNIANYGTASGAWNITGTVDPASVTVVNGDSGVLSWPEATQITGGSWDGDWNIDFSKKASWPECSAFPGSPNGGPIQYTIWLFVKVNGRWTGSGYIRNWVGGSNNGGPGDPKLQLPGNWYYSGANSPMPSCVALGSGTEVAFMVSNGNQRITDGVQCTATRERSNIVTVRLP